MSSFLKSAIVTSVCFVAAAHGFGRELADFGVVGDGRADDTAAIQKAIDSAAHEIRFPSGTYRLTKTVEIDLDKTGFVSLKSDGTARIVMEGAGPAFHFIGTHEGTADPDSVKPDVWAKQRMPTAEGLEIVGAHAGADGFEATGTMQLTITRCTVREARHAVHLTRRNRNVLISDCHFYHNRGIGVYLDQVDLHQTNINGCHISYCAGGGVVSRGGSVFNIQIGSCDIESNMTPDGPAGANVLLDCTNGVVAEVEITGCTIQHNSDSPGSANIRYIGRSKPVAGQSDVEKEKSGQLTITGNVISDVMVNVHIQHARGVAISGNTFEFAYDHDLIIEDSRQVVVGNNAFDRNPRYMRGRYAEANGGLLFQRSHDCILNGLAIHGVLRHPAAVRLEDCTGFNVTGCSITDSEGPGLLLKNVSGSLITACRIKDRRPDRKETPSIRIENGRDNVLANNLLSDSVDDRSSN